MAEPARQLPLLEVAARAPIRVLDERARGTRFLSVPARTALNGPESTRMGFFSLNPYVGCEFACSYCYARDTHRHAIERARRAGHLPHDEALAAMAPWEAFERRILVKRDLPALLARALDHPGVAEAELVIGTATDPYQPAERRFGSTRAVLELLAGRRGLRIGLISKSPLLTRDLDLMQELSRRHRFRVHVSLTTADAALARRLEPQSPAPHARLRALGRLCAAGIDAGLLIAPIVPLLTDGEASLRRLFRAATAAGARRVYGVPLRLGAAARRRFLPHLAREFPALAPRYARHFGMHTSTSRGYRRALERRVRRLQEEFGVAVPRDPAGLGDDDVPPPVQFALFGASVPTS